MERCELLRAFIASMSQMTHAMHAANVLTEDEHRKIHTTIWHVLIEAEAKELAERTAACL